MDAAPILQLRLPRRRFVPAAVVVGLHVSVIGVLLTQRGIPLSVRTLDALTVVELRAPLPAPPPP